MKQRTEGLAIVVLGCKVDALGAPSPALSRRLRWGAAAYHCGLAEAVIVAGGRRWGEHTEATVMSRALEALGVPPERVFPEMLSMTTAENAVFVQELMLHEGFRKALVVTCSFHLPRALQCFRTVGVDVQGLSAPSPPLPWRAAARRRIHEASAQWIDQSYLRKICADRAQGFHPFTGPRV